MFGIDSNALIVLTFIVVGMVAAASGAVIRTFGDYRATVLVFNRVGMIFVAAGSIGAVALWDPMTSWFARFALLCCGLTMVLLVVELIRWLGDSDEKRMWAEVEMIQRGATQDGVDR